MVKERKLQIGASNLSAREGEAESSPAKSGIRLAHKSNFVRTWSHQLLAPDMYQAPEAVNKNFRDIPTTATWRPSEVVERDFTTTHKSTFPNPKDAKSPDPHPSMTTAEIAKLNEQERFRREAVENMVKIVKNTHGTVASMLKSFNKKKTDDLTFHEFTTYIKRHKMDTYIPEADMPLIFEYVNTEHNSKLPVREFLQKIEEVEFFRNEHNQEHQKIKDFLEFHLAQKKGKNGDNKPTNAEIEAIKRQKGVENEAERMRRALGMKTFSVDVSHEEFDDVIDDIISKKHPNHDSSKIARYLHHTNLKLSQVPFYDNRATELDRLKHRAAEVHQYLHDPKVINHYNTLRDTVHTGALTTVHSDDFLQTFNGFKATRYEDIYDNKNQNAGTSEEEYSQAPVDYTMQLSKSMPSLPVSARPSPLQAIDAPRTEISLPEQEASSPLKKSGRLSPITHPNSNLPPPASAEKKNLITDSARGNDITSIVTPPRQRAASPLSLSSSKKSLTKNNDLQQSSMTDFFVKVVKEDESMGRMRDSSKVLRIEKVDHLEQAHQGRRIVADNINKTINIANEYKKQTVGEALQQYILSGHNSTTTFERDNDPYLSVANKFYAPLVYKPSQPVARDVISDAEISYKTKEFRRQQRFLRKQANMENTQSRLEFERMEKEIRSMHRTNGRVTDAIRYKTNIFLQDLQSFRSQPLQRMAKRQNIDLADRMWGGTMHAGQGQEMNEKVDLTTTYRASFDANVLTQSPVLKHPIDSVAGNHV